MRKCGKFATGEVEVVEIKGRGKIKSLAINFNCVKRPAKFSKLFYRSGIIIVSLPYLECVNVYKNYCYMYMTC